MITPLDELDVQRARWRRAREKLRLTDPEADDFATDGLARRLDNPRIRLLILPADPEALVVEFDDEFWEWWHRLPPHPATGQPTDWGYTEICCSPGNLDRR